MEGKIRPQGNRRRVPVAALVALFAAAAAVGAYSDWEWWQPYSGLTITLAAGAILIVAVLLAVVGRARRRGMASAVAVVGLGLLAGQNLGPSRPALEQSQGRMTVTLTSPRSTTGSIAAYCSMDAGATELLVYSDANLRLDVVPDDPSIPADVDQREFALFEVSVGERWIDGSVRRPDDLVLSALVGRVEADAPESRMSSDPSSRLDLAWTAGGGTMTFAGLVLDTRFKDASGGAIDLAGTIEWTC
jgi:hypothetical protein